MPEPLVYYQSMIRFRHQQAHRVQPSHRLARLGFACRIVRDAFGFALVLGWCAVMLISLWSLM